MKKLSFFLMAMLFTCATTLQAAEVTETIAMKGFGGLTTTSYENVTKTGTSDLGTEMVAYAFNPTNGQIRGNKTTIAGASVTTADKNKNWSLYNTQAMPGAIKKITVTQTATGSNMFKGKLFVALGTTNQGAVTTVTGAQQNTTGTATEFTFDIDTTQGYTYFKLLSNVAFTGGSVAGAVVTVTYVTAEGGEEEVTKYTVTANVNDPAMGSVSGAGEYAEGKTATLTANANPGYKFVNWSNASTDNPLKITVTEDIEITANFEAVPPMTCAEAAAAASGATVVLNPFDVVAVVKGAGYIYIKDESGVALIYDFTMDDQLKAGDHVEGFVGVSSPYNGLPELKPSVAFADLTVTPGTAPEPTLFTEVPTKADLNKYVKFENVTLTANATFTTESATNATMVVNGTNVTLRNTFKLAATLSKDKAYNIVGFAAIYNSTIQVYFLSAEEYVAPVVNHTITVSANPAEAGTVTGGGEYEEGATATLTATANEGYEFVKWTENEVEVSTDAEYTFEVLADHALVANFELIPPTKFTVTATAENGTVEGAGEYEEGTEVTLTATAAEGYEFVNWTSGETVVSTENPYKFTVTADLALVANFKKAAPATETVYFINTKKWAAVKAHVWGGKAAESAWPGKATVKETEKVAGYDVYSFTANVGDYANIIFNNNNGGSQTPDLVWTAGKYYVIDMGWLTKEEAETKLAAPLPETWNIVGDAGLMGKGWDLNAAENAMTKQADGTYLLEKKDITITAGTYEYKAAKDHGWTVGVPQDGNQKLTISKSGIYDITFVLNVTAKTLKATATLKKEAVVIPTVIIAGDMNGWDQNKDKFTMSADSLTATFKATLTAKSYGFKMIVGGAWHSDGKTITRAANSTKFTGANSNTNSTLKADIAGDYIFTWEYATKTLTVTYPALPVKYNVTVTAENGTVTGAGTYEEGTEVSLTATPAAHYVFVNWTNGEDVVSTENPYTFAVTADVTLVANFALDTHTVAVTAENGTVAGAGSFTHGTEVSLTATPADGYQFVNWTNGEEEVSTDNPYTFVVAEDVAFVANFELIPVVEPEKPEPTYTENNLNPYAFGLESKLSADKETLTVTYRLNNSNATSVNVLVYNGEEVVATVAGTTTIGKNTVEVPTADLPGGVKLTWAVEVNGTSVAAPTAETKIYSFYHPSGVDIDINPENETFGMLLVNEGMQSVASKTEGYVSAKFGAGIFAFTPSFDLIPNGELPGYNGGIEFTTTRADGTGTAYAPRRIRISEDGRIFVTSLNTDGNYLWEVNPANMNEWTTVFSGTLNENKELVDAEGNFIAAPNTGFDVKGAGENLQLAMYSVNLSGITAAAMSGFRLHEYNLGTATEWTTAPSKALVEGKYAINYTGTQVEYDNEGGLWICSYRGAANDANPGLVHINAEGVEDAKLVWNNVRQAGIRFNKDFTKLVVAGNNGAAKKATIYTISKDANGAPVLTQEAVVDMANVGNNLNDFAWDYAGNLYSCGNSAEKLAAWAMPYSGKVETPAASKYAFELDYNVMDITMTNLEVQEMGELVVLTASDDENTGLNVTLAINKDGSINEMSYASIIAGWMETELPILEGTITKAYSEELATDVYSGLVVVLNNGAKLGLNLTMYATPAIDVVIENATITVEELPDGVGGTYELINVSAPWGESMLVIEGIEKNHEGFVQIKEIIIVDGEEDWYIWMCENAVVTTVDNVLTVTGKFKNHFIGVSYNVTISGNLPQGPGTALDNVDVEAKTIKMIKNGQLIIIKNDVQYNVQGQVIK